MDVNVVKLVCPTCTTATQWSDPQAAPVCESCGHTIEPPEDGVDDALVGNLRRAFELDSEALRSAGPCRLRGGVGSSAVYARCSDAAALPAGTLLGDFEVLGELGRGGMGIVYRARQVSLGREVALKVLPDYARHGRIAVQRFRAEAQAAARLHHTNIVPIYAQGDYAGHFYYAMELIDGLSLDAVIHGRPERAMGATPAASPPTYRHVAALLADVADALECAHQHGVIHRDVKPHNLLLSTNNRLHLTDFGLARLTDAPHLTLSGELMGTPAYLSPEQVRGDCDGVDHRTDVYSLGVTLYELLTRRRPFEGGARAEILHRICTEAPARPRRLDPCIPVELETICMRAIEKAPGRRHPTAAVLAEDLRRFAEGRPILSRRPTVFTKAGRWVGRHRTATATAAVVLAIVILSGGFLWSARAARQREASGLLQRAYEQLAYVDYRIPQLVEADVSRAAALGANKADSRVVEALVCLARGDESGAIARLEQALLRNDTDLRSRYLLAWAQRRGNDFGAARTTLAEAERHGPPETADAWFFRGLAVHFDDPAEALRSYRQAIATRAAAQAMYPQAILHLARARNQQLYATRSLDAFPEAVESLEQLVKYQQYGAYPYYLLSIAHRLAAEIYSGSNGIRGDALVEEHHAAALDWARRGQELEPDNDRPITAEAEALESMGRYAEAIEARTRAIDTATQPRARCEGYHYRWRLHYWTGDNEAALEDMRVHAECMPENRQYADVYPALLLAEMGELEDALRHARRLAERQPDSALGVIWSATCLRLLGRAEEATALLARRTDVVDFVAEHNEPQSEKWLQLLYAHCLTGNRMAELEALAKQGERPWKLWGAAYFHDGARRLVNDDRAGARARFQQAYRAFDGELHYTYHAKLIGTRMQQDPAWPPWIVPYGNRDAMEPSSAPPELKEGRS